MSANTVEDALISRLDDSRAGITPLMRDDLSAEERAAWRPFIEALDDAKEQAHRTFGMTDLEIEEKKRAVENDLTIAEEKLRRFCQPESLSRRRMRTISDDDDEGDKKLILAGLEQRVADLRREYEDLEISLNARRYLKEQPELQRRVLHLRGKDVEIALGKWNELYPDGARRDPDGARRAIVSHA